MQAIATHSDLRNLYKLFREASGKSTAEAVKYHIGDLVSKKDVVIK